ncbi:MAG: hypothetical protein WD063_21010 [Pirellulales bacterium]
MDSRRALGGFVACCLLVVVIVRAGGAAQSDDKHPLKAQHRPGDLARVQIAFQVGGEVNLVADDGETKNLPMSVVANLAYDERVLALDASGRPAKTVRYYDDARAVIKIDKGGEKPDFHPARRLIIAERTEKGPCQLYCPTAALVREELDLVDLPGGSLVLDDVLPAAPVALGDSWKLADTTLAALLCLDAVGWSDVECVLGEVKDGLADIAAAGSVSGAVGGISTDIQLKIKYKFDVRARRITAFGMLIKEKRAVGHVGPGLDTVAKLIVRITPISASKTLTGEVFRRLPPGTTPELLELGYVPKGGQFRFQYDRRWYLTSDDPKLAVLRMLDRGELVAQCNLSALPVVKKPVTLAEFQRDVERSLDKNFGQFKSAAQTVNESGYAVFRVVVDGTISQLPIEWIYYLVQDRQGHRVSLAFTLEQSLRERFAEADRRVVEALKLTEPPTPTVARPVKSR